MWSVDVRWWAVITLWLLMCLMPVFSHCCRNVNEYVWNIYETQWPSDLVCMFNFPYFMLTHNFKNKFLLIPKRQHVCLFLWRKTKSHDCQTTNNLIKYGWPPNQKCSASSPLQPRGHVSPQIEHFEICMLHVVRLPLHTLGFPVDVTVLGLIKHNALEIHFSAALLWPWQASTR